MLRRVSLLTLFLEPLGSLLWILFLISTALVAVLWCTPVGEAQLGAWVSNPGLRSSLLTLLKLADAIWIGLAAACAYLCVADTHGVGTARRWALTAFAVVGSVVAVNVWTGWFFGPVVYTQRLGIRLGPVPAGVPLLWMVIVLGGRALWMRIFRRASHNAVALGAALCAVLTAWNLEPLASGARAWWFWISPETRAPIAPPLQNYATWLLLAATLAWLFREPRVVGSPPAHSDRLIAILALVNVVCFAARIAAVMQR